MSVALRLPYPTNWMLGVADRASIAAAGVDSARAVGASKSQVRELHVEGAGIASLAHVGRLEALLNVLRHLNTDQAADLVVYEAARRDGRIVVAVHNLGSTARQNLAAAWRDAGLHFVAHYGRIATEDWDGWRGEPLASVPSWAWR